MEGKKGLIEECFAANILELATNYTMMRYVTKMVEQEDLTEGTYPAGGAWRHVTKMVPGGIDAPQILRKNMVRVPYNLPEGDFVLSSRWDTTSCKKIVQNNLPNDLFSWETNKDT